MMVPALLVDVLVNHRKFIRLTVQQLTQLVMAFDSHKIFLDGLAGQNYDFRSAGYQPSNNVQSFVIGWLTLMIMIIAMYVCRRVPLSKSTYTLKQHGRCFSTGNDIGERLRGEVWGRALNQTPTSSYIPIITDCSLSSGSNSFSQNHQLTKPHIFGYNQTLVCWFHVSISVGPPWPITCWSTMSGQSHESDVPA